ncbi:DUF4349 domain-containing protein [Actinokineospora guangxiensis]|uniref:DUF4349 domain-containing protein n=1 Tax=Actinokineospora guangxiensis TaxID=1490288 RepID=A0ABW0EII7_9PSEU
MNTKRLLSVLLLAAIGTAGCTSSSDSAGSSGEYAVAPAPAQDSGGAAADREAAAPAQAAPTQAAPPAEAKAAQVSQPGVERSLIRTASLSMTVPTGDATIADAVFDARAIVSGAGGYTGDQDVERTRATMTLHVPSDQLDRVVDELTKIGKVVSSTQTAEDVTEQLVDVDSRVKTQRASLDRVRALLAKAVDIDEIVRIEAEVTRREADLESLLKRRETLSGQVAVSTVTLTFRQSGDVAAPPVREDEGLGAAFKDGWSAFTGFVGSVAESLARLLPFLVLLGIAAVVAWVRWVRPARQRRRVVPVVGREVPQEG